MGSGVEVRSLEVLLAVAEHGSLGAAARSLGVTQPAVTDRVRRLERQFGLQLLQRSPRGSRLTTEGATVVDWARAVLAAATRLEVGVAALRERHSALLRVSASKTIAEHLAPRWLADLRSRLPSTRVSLRVRNSQEVTSDLLDGWVDLGFVEGTSVHAGLNRRTVATDELVVVAAPEPRWTRRRRPLHPHELADLPLILREEGSGTREAFERAMARLGHRVTPRLELGSSTAIKSAIAAGGGLSVLSRLAVTDELRSGQLVAVSVAGIDLTRHLRAVWRGGTQPVGPAAELLRCALRSHQPGDG